MTDEIKIYQGGNIKQLEDGRIGGYLVTFSDEDSPDLEGDFFTPDTDFGGAKSTPIWFNHRLPMATKNGSEIAIKERIGKGELTIDEHGVFIEAVLYNREKYDEALDALGWSSGTAAHLMETEPAGKATRITMWPLGLDASLTPTPAEPRNKAVSLKTLQSIPEGGDAEPADEPQGAGDAPADEPQKPIKQQPMEEQIIMSDNVEPVVNEPQVIDYDKIGAMLDGALKARLDEMTVKPEQPVKAVNINIGDDTYLKSFEKLLSTGGRDAKALKALEAGTTTEGGYLVPAEWRNEIVKPLTDMSFIRSAGARVISVPAGSGDTFYIPTLTNMTAAVLTDEEDAYDDADPTIGQVAFTPYKYTRTVKASEELVGRANFDIWGSILSGDFLQAFAAAENAAFTTGTGSNQPQGVVTGAGTGKTAASATAITADEVIETFHSLDYKYRSNAVWMMNDAVALVVRKLTDGAGQYLWQPALAAGQPSTLLGRPVINNSSMASSVAASAKTILFGNFDYYYIGDWENFSVDVNPYLYMANGQIGYFGRKSFDGNVMLAAAFKLLVQASS
jgi:HK97 family phage major capsid protein